MKLKGSDIMMECLLEQGVDTVFGYPGGTVINLYDSLYKYSDKINHVLTAHEQGASHAADGYARSTGKVGVCIATSGPGATNLRSLHKSCKLAVFVMLFKRNILILCFSLGYICKNIDHYRTRSS